MLTADEKIRYNFLLPSKLHSFLKKRAKQLRTMKAPLLRAWIQQDMANDKEYQLYLASKDLKQKTKAILSAEVKKKPVDWLKQKYPTLVILDPDGWDRRADEWEASWNREITESDFESKLARCTVMDTGKILSNNLGKI